MNERWKDGGEIDEVECRRVDRCWLQKAQNLFLLTSSGRSRSAKTEMLMWLTLTGCCRLDLLSRSRAKPPAIALD